MQIIKPLTGFYFKTPNTSFKKFWDGHFPESDFQTIPAEILKSRITGGIDRKELSILHPSLLCYTQYYSGEDGSSVDRSGIVALLRVDDSEQKTVFLHENVTAPQVDRLAEHYYSLNLQTTTAFGFFDDTSGVFETLLKNSKKSTYCRYTDDKNILHQTEFITNAALLQHLEDFFSNKPIFLGDGHHRYQALLKLKKEKNIQPYLLIYLVNQSLEPVSVSSIHRLLKFGNCSENEFIEKIKEDFFIEEYSNFNIIPLKKHTFQLIFKNKTIVATLKPGKLTEIDWNFPPIIKELDQTVLHYFFIQKYLGIQGQKQKNCLNIKFSPIFEECVESVKNGASDVAVISKKITLEEIKKVSVSGFTFPQKSTYFYPKTFSGLLFAKVF